MGHAGAGEASGAGDPDLPLVHAMARGDERALQDLYDRHGRSVWAYLVGLLRDPHLADEVLQDVMLAAWRTAHAFRGACRVRTWLLTIAHNRAVNAARRCAREPVEPVGRATPAPCREAPDPDLYAALRSLRPHHRAVLELVFFQELSVDETALVLGVAPGTVKSRLFRARRALRRALDPGSSGNEHLDGALRARDEPAVNVGKRGDR